MSEEERKAALAAMMGNAASHDSHRAERYVACAHGEAQCMGRGLGWVLVQKSVGKCRAYLEGSDDASCALFGAGSK